jgi:hypothetical protein
MLLLVGGCADARLPTGPVVPASQAPTSLVLQAEPGSGDGFVLERSRALGGQTLHLAPGERRNWNFSTRGDETRYGVTVSYSNSGGGAHEILTVQIDGASLAVFEVADTGDETEGWNVFAVHPAGALPLRAGEHTLVIQSSGRDGCVEIDFVSLSPN